MDLVFSTAFGIKEYSGPALSYVLGTDYDQIGHWGTVNGTEIFAYQRKTGAPGTHPPFLVRLKDAAMDDNAICADYAAYIACRVYLAPLVGMPIL